MAGLSELEAEKIRQELHQGLAQHKADTEKVVERLAANIEKLTDAVTNLRVYQAELNNVGSTVQSLSIRLESQGSEIATLKQNAALSESFMKKVDKVQVSIWAALLLMVLAAGFNFSQSAKASDHEHVQTEQVKHKES